MDRLVRPCEEDRSKNRTGDEEVRLLEQGEDSGDSLSKKREPDGSTQKFHISSAAFGLLSAISRRRGIFYAIITGVFNGLQMAFVGWLRSSISPYQIMFWRGIIYLLPVAFVSWDAGVDYTVADMIYYIGLGFFNALGVLLGFVSAQLAHVGNTTAITFNLPIPATIVGFFVLRETITRYDILLFAINLIGLVLVSKPPFIFGGAGDSLHFDEFLGALIAVAGLLCLVIMVIFSRKLAYRQHSDPALSTITSGMLSLILPAMVLLYTQTWDRPSTLLEMLAIPSAGTCGMIANVFLIRALKLETVSVVSVTVTISIPVSFLLGLVMVQEIPDLVSVLGAIFVFASTCGCLLK